MTTEANPESVDPPRLAQLRKAGFTRISLGMQSTAPHVLALLDRRHTPGRAAAAATEAREAGFEHVNLDLIYGTPGERAEDFDASLQAAVAAGVDHVSAYSLIVEDGTRLAARVRRGEVPTPDDDVAADRYLAAEAALAGAGFGWYEVSNWSRSAADAAGTTCSTGAAATGGASGRARTATSAACGGGTSSTPRRTPSACAPGPRRPRPARSWAAPQRHTEEVMLRLRLAEGLPLERLDGRGGPRPRARSPTGCSTGPT